MLIKKFDYNEIPEVFIIDDHFDKIFYSLEFQLLFFEYFDICQKFFITNLVVIFGWDIFDRKKSNKVENLYQIILKEYISRNPIQNVGFDNRSLIEIEKNK